MRWLRVLAAPFVLLCAAGSGPGFAIYMFADRMGWRGETAAFVSGLTGGVLAAVSIAVMLAEHER